jgi:hypothetical protein
MGSDSSAVRCTGIGAVFAGVAPLDRLTLLEGVSAERDVGASVSGFWDMVAVLLVGRLTLFDGVAEGCEADPLGAYLGGVEVAVEAGSSGRLAAFEGVAEFHETEPFAVPLTGRSWILDSAFVGVAFLGRRLEGVAE